MTFKYMPYYAVSIPIFPMRFDGLAKRKAGGKDFGGGVGRGGGEWR